MSERKQPNSRVRRKLEGAFQAAARFQRLPCEEKIALAEASIGLTLVRLGLEVVPFEWTAKVARASSARSTSERRPEVARVSRAVQRAAHYLPFEVNCLPQAIAGKLMLARLGIDSQVVVGVRQVGRGSFAHAWLRVDGEAVIGGVDESGFAVIATY